MSTDNIEPKTESTQQYAVFSEPIQISEDVSCCLKVNAVIAKEGIYTFPAGAHGEDLQCLWSRAELLKAARTARAAKITINEHPPGKVVTSQDEIYGTVEKPFFDRDRIRAVLSFDKDICPPDFLESVRAAASKEGMPRDVSIGFYYSEDPTPGEWHGQHYDMAMRNIVIDHVAAGVVRGRCSYPNCGIGVSSQEVKDFAAASQQKKAVNVSAGNVEVSPSHDNEVVLPTPPTSPAKEPAPITEPKIEPKTAPIVKQFKAVDTNVPTETLLSKSAGLLKLFEMDRLEKFKAERRRPA